MTECVKGNNAQVQLISLEIKVLFHARHVGIVNVGLIKIPSLGVSLVRRLGGLGVAAQRGVTNLITGTATLEENLQRSTSRVCVTHLEKYTRM